MSNPKQTIRSVQISKAKSSLNSLVKRVHRDHEYLILKDNGTPLAAVMDIDEFEDYLEVNDPKVRRAIEMSNEDIREGRTRPAREFLEELRREERPKEKATRRRE
jgi:prevent-host-death family protein